MRDRILSGGDNRAMGTSLDERRDRAVDALVAEISLPGLLHSAARQFVEAVDATACSLSRLVGEVLIEVAEFAVDGRTLALGHGYLVPDFPLTQDALEADRPQTASLLDPEPDPTEARLLRELGLDSLAMLPLTCAGSRWGLVEIYVNGRRFADDEVASARALAGVVGERLEQLPAPGTGA
jgi:GAF domain-containing protein